MSSAETMTVLPSDGIPYGNALPGGEVRIRRYTMETEERFASSQAPVDERLHEMVRGHVVLPEGLTYDSLLVTDQVALLIALRIHSYGPWQALDMKCRACLESSRINVNIAESFDTVSSRAVEAKIRQHAGYEDFKYAPVMVYRLPLTGLSVGLRHLLVKDAAEIKSIVRNRNLQGIASKVDPKLRLSRAIRTVSINGEEVTNLSVAEQLWRAEWKDCDRDALEADLLRLARFMDATDTGVETKATVRCPICGAENRVEVPMDAEFFRPSDF